MPDRNAIEIPGKVGTFREGHLAINAGEGEVSLEDAVSTIKAARDQDDIHSLLSQTQVR